MCFRKKKTYIEQSVFISFLTGVRQIFIPPLSFLRNDWVICCPDLRTCFKYFFCMHMSMRTCIHMYTYEYVHMHIHVYTHSLVGHLLPRPIYMYEYSYMPVCMHIYMYVRIHVHVYVHIYMYSMIRSSAAQTYEHVHTCLYTYKSMHTCIYIYVHIYICTHIHKYVHTLSRLYACTHIHSYLCIRAPMHLQFTA